HPTHRASGRSLCQSKPPRTWTPTVPRRRDRIRCSARSCLYRQRRNDCLRWELLGRARGGRSRQPLHQSPQYSSPFDQKRTRRTIMKVLVAGGSLMAVRLIESLMHKHQVVCLTSVASPHLHSEHLNAEVLEGPITSPASLTDAGAGDVDVFVACSTSDEQNIVACMAAHRLGAKRTLCVIN